jgi:hypothetical protein
MLLTWSLACNHPVLVSKNFKADEEAVDPKPIKNVEDDGDEDELANMFGKLGVAAVRTCQVCQTE